MRCDPPYRLTTERLVLRCWDPRDAPLLKDAIDTSLDHLREWMPWAHAEPQPLPAKIDLLRRFRGAFDLGHDYVYGIFDSGETEVVGGTGLHTRAGDDAFEIGYWIRASRVREGLATEAVAALTRVALGLCGAERLEIHVDPANGASLAVPRKLGYAEEATLRRRLPGRPGERRRDEVVFSLLREELVSTPSGACAVEAFDSTGQRLL